MEHPEVEEDGRMVSLARVVDPGRLPHAGEVRGKGREGEAAVVRQRRHSTLVSTVSSGGTWRRDSRARRSARREGSHRRTSPRLASPRPGRRGSPLTHPNTRVIFQPSVVCKSAHCVPSAHQLHVRLPLRYCTEKTREAFPVTERKLSDVSSSLFMMDGCVNFAECAQVSL
ncbi:hypothetical protein E2C01_012557 [Portunus trituberculatus]|uniref:Uncharacterized protein n=1 Tax=Portunus trituberculatus TaxID=210409 RepID=A0A5B7DEF1_PORTR|nr:hypothetical protein [Portunus trituberculatus]